MRDETVLAFDFGVKRIGVAIGERRLGEARALLLIDDEANGCRTAARKSSHQRPRDLQRQAELCGNLFWNNARVN